MSIQYIRGGIYYCNLPEIQDIQNHSVQRGCRPVVIVSSPRGLIKSDVVMVCPLTTKIKQLKVNVNVAWSIDKYSCSQVLCNQIMTVPKQSLHNFNGRLTPDELKRVDDAILISLGITRGGQENDSEFKYVKRSI
jgi:mRNA interferase MazF